MLCVLIEKRSSRGFVGTSTGGARCSPSTHRRVTTEKCSPGRSGSRLMRDLGGRPRGPRAPPVHRRRREHREAGFRFRGRRLRAPESCRVVQRRDCARHMRDKFRVFLLLKDLVPSPDVGLSFWSACVKDESIHFDLHEHRRVYQRVHFHHRGGRSHLSELFSVGPTNVLPVSSYVHHVHACPDDVPEAGTSSCQGRRHILQRLNGLNTGIADTDNLPGFVRRHCARHPDHISDADGTRITNQRFPRRTGGKALTLHAKHPRFWLPAGGRSVGPIWRPQVRLGVGERTRERRLFLQQVDDVVPDRVEAYSLVRQNGSRHGRFLAEDAQEEMLGADVVVQQSIGLFSRKLKDAFGFGAERDLDRGRSLFAEDGAPSDFIADVVAREVRAAENAVGDPFGLTDQPKQQMLGSLPTGISVPR
jgi:hypothetical protein